MRISDWSSDVCSSDLGHHSLQRLPDVDQMARQTPRRKEHHVDSDRIVRTREARGEYFRRRRDPAQAPGVDGEIQIFDAVAPFDLDEGAGAAAPRDTVALADRKSGVSGKMGPVQFT